MGGKDQAIVVVARLHCKDRHGELAPTAMEFLSDPQFWFESFQNWQSEFLSIGLMIVLTIFLRQKGSPQSKPGSPHWNRSATARTGMSEPLGASWSAASRTGSAPVSTGCRKRSGSRERSMRGPFRLLRSSPRRSTRSPSEGGPGASAWSRRR